MSIVKLRRSSNLDLSSIMWLILEVEIIIGPGSLLIKMFSQQNQPFVNQVGLPNLLELQTVVMATEKNHLSNEEIKVLLKEIEAMCRQQS